MGNDANAQDRDEVVRSTYTPDQDWALTDAVIDAIGRKKGDEISMTEFVLYDDIDPDALDNLFRHDARPRTTVEFETDGVQVELWGDGGVEIRVRDRPGE